MSFTNVYQIEIKGIDFFVIDSGEKYIWAHLFFDPVLKNSNIRNETTLVSAMQLFKEITEWCYANGHMWKCSECLMGPFAKICSSRFAFRNLYETQLDSLAKNAPKQAIQIMSHRIHVWNIYLHLVDFYGECR